MSPHLPPVDPQAAVLGDEVYALLGEAIVDGRLGAGERLRDHELADHLGVSRTPVREALQRLERAGLVEVAPNRYTKVSVPNDRVSADTHELFVYLMGSALRIALQRCTDDELATVVEHVDDIVAASASDDHPAIMATSGRFFERVVDDADNVAFARVLREAEIAIRRNIAGRAPFIDCPARRTAAYEQFRDAVRLRDGDRAESLLRDLHGVI
jgi:DNA-binding GntR family transcriptional regulator